MPTDTAIELPHGPQAEPTIARHRHSRGGGWVDDTALVADTAFVGQHARVKENAMVYGDAQIHGYACIMGNAEVSGHAQVYGIAQVHGYARISGNSRVWGIARIFEYAQVCGDAQVSDLATVFGSAIVRDNAKVTGSASVGGNTEVCGNTVISEDMPIFPPASRQEPPLLAPAEPTVARHRHSHGGGWVDDTAEVADTAFVGLDARVKENARVYGHAQIYEYACVSGNARILDHANIYGLAEVMDNAEISGESRVYGNARVYGYARVCENAQVYGMATVFASAIICGDAIVFGVARIHENTRVCGNEQIAGEAEVFGEAEFTEATRVSGRTHLGQSPAASEDAAEPEPTFRCYDCGSLAEVGSAHYHPTLGESDDRRLCEPCWQQRCDEEEAEEENPRVLHDHSYQPPVMKFITVHKDRGIKHQTRKPENELYLGFELEVEAVVDDYHREYDIECCGLDGSGEFYCKEDGSLDNGFEIVSQPATFEHWWHHSLDFADKLAAKNYRSYNTKTCGFHVHISRKSPGACYDTQRDLRYFANQRCNATDFAMLSDLDVYKLLLFARNNPMLLVQAARRSQELISQWAKIDPRSTTATALISKAKKVLNRRSPQGARYAAINTVPENTVEIRIFRGTLNVESIKRNLAFVAALVAFVKHSSATSDAMNGREFFKWLRADGWRILGRAPAKAVYNWLADGRMKRFDSCRPRDFIGPRPLREPESNEV